MKGEPKTTLIEGDTVILNVPIPLLGGGVIKRGTLGVAVMGMSGRLCVQFEHDFAGSAHIVSEGRWIIELCSIAPPLFPRLTFRDYEPRFGPGWY